MRILIDKNTESLEALTPQLNILGTSWGAQPF